MRAPNLHLPHLHMPHLRWPHLAFQRPDAGLAWALALLVLLGAAILLALIVAVTNPAYFAPPDATYPMAPI